MMRFTAALFVAVLALPTLAHAQAQPAMGPTRVERTLNYTLTLGIGAAEEMAPQISTDQGMVVNHHLELRVMHADSDMMVTDVTPVIRITDKLSGVSRDLPQVMGMLDPGMGMTDFHYGQNLFLPDGTYQVTVMIGSDTAQFRDVMVEASPMMGHDNSTSQSHDMGMAHEMAPAPARDGQMFSQQPAATQALFTAVWGDRAADEWVKEHDATLPPAA